MYASLSRSERVVKLEGLSEELSDQITKMARENETGFIGKKKTAEASNWSSTKKSKVLATTELR